jgi:hypothetical protein
VLATPEVVWFTTGRANVSPEIARQTAQKGSINGALAAPPRATRREFLSLKDFYP